MNNWFQPPEFRYSLKSHFTFTPPPHVHAAVAAAAEAASASAGAGSGGIGAAGAGGRPPVGPRGYYSHGHGYGRAHHWRPRFGLFRRMVWFGLGVGAASWYIHHKEKDQEVRRTIMSTYRHPTPHTPSNPSMNDQMHQPMQWHAPPRLPTGPEAVPEVEAKEGHPKWEWGARREARRQTRHDAFKREADEIKEAWSERKRDWTDVKVPAAADDKTREYAKDKLDVLTRALDKLREALDEDKTGDERKMV